MEHTWRVMGTAPVSVVEFFHIQRFVHLVFDECQLLGDFTRVKKHESREEALVRSYYMRN